MNYETATVQRTISNSTELKDDISQDNNTIPGEFNLYKGMVGISLEHQKILMDFAKKNCQPDLSQKNVVDIINKMDLDGAAYPDPEIDCDEIAYTIDCFNSKKRNNVSVEKLEKVQSTEDIHFIEGISFPKNEIENIKKMNANIFAEKEFRNLCNACANDKWMPSTMYPDWELKALVELINSKKGQLIIQEEAGKSYQSSWAFDKQYNTKIQSEIQKITQSAVRQGIVEPVYFYEESKSATRYNAILELSHIGDYKTVMSIVQSFDANDLYGINKYIENNFSINSVIGGIDESVNKLVRDEFVTKNNELHNIYLSRLQQEEKNCENYTQNDVSI